MYGLSAIISERTVARAGHLFPTFELDVVMVKGRERTTRIFTLLQLLSSDPDQLAHLQLAQNRFLDAYRRQHWDEAEHILAGCREIGIASLATYYSLFASRITALRHTTLPSDWNGSFAMTEK
jgi:hypothetical protein